MVAKLGPPLSELYETDETAWLEAMAERIELGQLEGLDYEHLREYLTDMAIRDRREVVSRLVVLLVHLLKWRFQPALRTRSWSATIMHQQFEIQLHAAKGVLRRHAIEVLEQCFAKAVALAAEEAGLSIEQFPAECPWTLDQLLDDNLTGD